MIYYGDCLDVMANMESDSIDLIVTSPPYADARKHTYGGVAPDEYVDWFLPRAKQIKRIMRPTGSFVLNIKERAEKGEKLTYVLDLILALKREVGFRWVDEFIWHKKNVMPGKYPYRLRDAWERLLHFAKEEQIKMRQDAVKIKPSLGTLGISARVADPNRITDADKINRPTDTGSGFQRNLSNTVGRDMVLPTNVLHYGNLGGVNKGHSAAYPDKIPEFFIRLFTDEGDTVLDPFLGSGTTYKVAENLGRKALGIEILEEYQHLHQPDQQLRLI